ncbi:MAG: sensor histidine kinase [Gaiella sp.]
MGALTGARVAEEAVGERDGPLHERLHQALAGHAADWAAPSLDAAFTRASLALAGAGSSPDGEAIAAATYAADVLVLLAAEGGLEASDIDVLCAEYVALDPRDPRTARYDLFTRAVRSPVLFELPPLVAVGIQTGLLLHFGVVTGLSMWRPSQTGAVECVFQLGSEQATRRVRATAKAALRRSGGFALHGRATLRTAPLSRFGETQDVLVARVDEDASPRVDAYLEECARAATPLLEREYLLERGKARAVALVSASERRLMRVGFDLHDGPIQDVLSLAHEVRHFCDQLEPFVVDSHRERAVGRFEDVLARLGELDRHLREVAQSLESKSVVSRPLAEILHREVDAFALRWGIEVRLEIKGDAEMITSEQRIAVFRAVQESLANVREHSGATRVDIQVQARRNALHVEITDNGVGFEVSRALTRAAQRGRLGLLGIAERVRMLGGTFSIESEPGSPTTLSFTLPHWESQRP